MKLPPLAAIEREVGLRGSFYDFVKMAWPLVEHGRPFVDNWHIGAVCEHLEAVFRGQIRNLSINIPPGCMKSLTTSVLWDPWCWIQDPGYRFIYGSFDETLVGKRDGTKVLDIVRSKWFRERWGDLVMIKGKEPSIGEFYTTRGGMRFATSVGGKVLGRHANAFVVDDPTKPQTMTALTLEETWRWKQETSASRLLPGGSFVLIMQRLHDRDMAGRCEEEGGYEILRLPMRYEKDSHCKTALGFSDPRTREGELLWPAYKDEAEVSKQEKEMGGQGSSVVAAQLQQRPAPAKGLIFEREWFKHWTSLPDKFDVVVDSWDCTFKDLETSDYVVGQRWGLKGSAFYLIARVRGHWNLPKTIHEVRAFRSRRDLPPAHAILIEDKANGPAVIAMLEKEVPGLIPVNPEGGKDVRAQAVTPLYEAGNVYHPPRGKEVDGIPVYAWVDDHETELLKFPKGKYDDSVDAETQALHWLRTKANKMAAAMDRLANEGSGWLFGRG